MFTDIRWVGSGWQGAPGYLHLRVRGALGSAALDAAGAAQRTFLTAVRPYMPASAIWAPDPYGTVVDEITGITQSTVNFGTAPGQVQGTSGLTYSSVSGLCIIWRTGVLKVRRLIVGRTFIVPAAGATDTSGKVTGAAITAITGGANAYIASQLPGVNGRPVVWTRPSKKGLANGMVSDATSSSVNFLGAELKSRRD